MERAGLTDVLVTGNGDQVDQGQVQADGDRRKALRRTAMGRAQDHEQKAKVMTISHTSAAVMP